MTYKVLWHDATVKDLKKISRKEAETIINKVEKIARS